MSQEKNELKHVAIIMDGNSRWAKKKHVPVSIGHTSGTKRLQDVIKVAKENHISYVTLYAFSTENWKREREEINHLMKIIEKFYQSEFNKILKNDIKINFIGTEINIPDKILKLFRNMEEKSENNQSLVLNIAFNYGAREELTQAMNKLKNSEGKITEEDINKMLYTSGQPDVDYLIRTSGEYRLSNFLLWQVAYAEFYFPEILWPDFTEEEFQKALDIFYKRKRRFGGR